MVLLLATTSILFPDRIITVFYKIPWKTIKVNKVETVSHADPLLKERIETGRYVSSTCWCVCDAEKDGGERSSVGAAGPSPLWSASNPSQLESEHLSTYSESSFIVNNVADPFAGSGQLYGQQTEYALTTRLRPWAVSNTWRP
jgi:hypothetical protein